MRNWTIRYKWASGVAVAERVNPPLDMHGGHEGVLTIRTTGGNVPPTSTRAKRATVGQLYRSHVHGDRYGWRIDRKISVLPVGYCVLKVVEYWPGFVDRSDEPKVAIVTDKSQILSVPWLKAKGADAVHSYFVMAGKLVVAHIFNDDDSPAL